MTKAARRHWLVKSEPSTFSFDDLQRSPGRTTCWDGVRNYAARNFMRDGMQLGDRVLFYHSSTEPPAMVGVCEVVREAYPDPSQFDASSPYHDPKSDPAAPTWMMVDLRAIAALPRALPLAELREVPALRGMELLKRGSRLSVQPVTAREYAAVLTLAGAAPDEL